MFLSDQPSDWKSVISDGAQDLEEGAQQHPQSRTPDRPTVYQAGSVWGKRTWCKSGLINWLILTHIVLGWMLIFMECLRFGRRKKARLPAVQLGRVWLPVGTGANIRFCFWDLAKSQLKSLQGSHCLCHAFGKVHRTRLSFSGLTVVDYG